MKRNEKIIETKLPNLLRKNINQTINAPRENKIERDFSDIHESHFII